MKSLYITSVEKYSGKTALCLALGKLYQERGLNIGYLKPFSLRPWRIGDKIADEDATFVIDILGINAKPWELAPVVVTNEMLRDYLTSKVEIDFMAQVIEAANKLEEKKDLLLLEGGGSLREGYVMNLPTPEVAKRLGSAIIVVVKYCEDACLLDDVLTAKFRLGEQSGRTLPGTQRSPGAGRLAGGPLPGCSLRRRDHRGIECRSAHLRLRRGSAGGGSDGGRHDRGFRPQEIP
jgi:BioD-like phosphotransacetylase family protein